MCVCICFIFFVYNLHPYRGTKACIPWKHKHQSSWQLLYTEVQRYFYNPYKSSSQCVARVLLDFTGVLPHVLSWSRGVQVGIRYIGPERCYRIITLRSMYVPWWYLLGRLRYGLPSVFAEALCMIFLLELLGFGGPLEGTVLGRCVHRNQRKTES